MSTDEREKIILTVKLKIFSVSVDIEPYKKKMFIFSTKFVVCTIQ